jgi:hypothetical protein
MDCVGYRGADRVIISNRDRSAIALSMRFSIGSVSAKCDKWEQV